IFFLSFFSFSVLFAQNFEGTITVKNTIPNTVNATFTLKNKMAMVDARRHNGDIRLISNNETGEKISISEHNGEKIAVVKNANDMQYRNLNQVYKKSKNRVNAVEVKILRETKEINGYKCYKVIASDRNYHGEAWITKKLEVKPYDLFPILKAQHRAMPRVAKALENSMDGFVMEMTLKNIKTKKVDKMKVIVNKKEIADDVFVVDTQKVKVYSEEEVRELMKAAKGNPEEMKKARNILTQVRLQ
ncbi:MAG: DUF4412 domain-containing protein, partial [Bacteroidota bacterium]